MGLFNRKKKLDWVDRFNENAIIDSQERIRSFIDNKLRYSKTSPLNYFRTYAGHKIYSNTYIFVVQFCGQPDFEVEMTEDDMRQLSFCKPRMEELVEDIRTFYKIGNQPYDEYGFKEG